MSEEKIVEFQAITGAAEDVCRRFLQQATWNLELALSNYFDAPPTDNAAVNIAPSAVPSTSQFSTTSSSRAPPVAAEPPSEVGLFACGSSASVPLKSLSVRALVRDHAAEVTITQLYVNTISESSPIEAMFKFAQENCSVVGFEAEVDGRRLVGAVKEKEEAFNTYDDGLAAGRRAFLLEQQADSIETFAVNVGNLPPHGRCTITIRYITELILEGEAIKLALPITKTRILTDGTAVTTPAGLTLHVRLEMTSSVTGVESPSHDIDVRIDGTTAELSLSTPANEAVALRREFVLRIGVAEPRQPRAVVEDGDVVMATFFPDIGQYAGADEPASEVVFLVDRSGSMAGSRMAQARNALQLFLRSLPLGSLFNIVGFGSRFEKLFPASVVPLDDHSFAMATAHVASMSADLAGTDLLPPLRDVLAATTSTLPRQLFVITDGDVPNTAEVIAAVRRAVTASRGGVRVFTVGIGSEASRELVLGLARAGRGAAELVMSGERLEPVVARQLRRALAPVLTDVNVDWSAVPAERAAVAPATLPPLFDGERVVAYAFLKRKLAPQDDVVVRLRAKYNKRDVVFATAPRAVTMTTAGVVRAVAARAVIRDLEETEAAAPAGPERNAAARRIAEWGVRYGLVTKHTAFVAVDQSGVPAEGGMRRVDIDEAVQSALVEPALPAPPSANLAPLPAFDDEEMAVALAIGAGQPVPEQLRRQEAPAAHAELRSALSVQRKSSLSSVLSRGADALSSVASKLKHKVSTAAKRAAESAPLRGSRDREYRARDRLSEVEAKLSVLDEPVDLLAADADTAGSPPSQLTLLDPFQPAPAGESMPANPTAARPAESPIGKEDPSSPQRLSLLDDSPFGEDELERSSDDDQVFNRGGNLGGMPSTTPQPLEAMPAGAASAVAGPSSEPEGLAATLWPAPPRPRSTLGSAFAAVENKPTAEALRGMREVDKVVYLQRANGSWAMDAQLASLVGASENFLLSHWPPEYKVLYDWPSVWATALAIVLLETKFAGERDEWEMLRAKAIRWIKRELANQLTPPPAAAAESVSSAIPLTPVELDKILELAKTTLAHIHSA